MMRLIAMPTLSAIAFASAAAASPPLETNPPPPIRAQTDKIALSTKRTPAPATSKIPEPPTPSVPMPAANQRGRGHRHLRRSASAIAHIVAAIAQRCSRRLPHGFVNAVQIYPFADGALYQVYTAHERVTDIALQSGETLGAVASSDTVRWVIGDTSSGSGADKRTHVLVKPFTTGLATNLVITTDRRVYHVALASTAGAVMAAVSWVYQKDALIALKHEAATAQAAVPIATGIEVEKLHFDYAISSDQPAWRPLRAFDEWASDFYQFSRLTGSR